MGNSIVGKTDRALSKEDDVVVCFPGAKIETITGLVGPGKGCSLFLYFNTHRD